MNKAVDQRLRDLYDAHAIQVRRLAYLITGDAHEAEDLVQEAFVRVGARLLTLRDPERAAGYIFRTVINLGRDHGRRLRRYREIGDRLAAPAVVTPGEDLADRDRMWRALMKLPVRHRAVLFLRYYMDLSEARAAELLNCSTSAVRSLNHRATESLKKQLQGDQT